MSESFDDMMRRAFGDDFGAAPELQAELCDLLDRYALPPDGVLHVLEVVIELMRPLARLRLFADDVSARRWSGRDFVGTSKR